MHRIFHFESPRERYKSDAAVVWCYDHRFELAFSKLLKRIGIIYSDPIRVAGGAKCLARPDQETDRAFVLDQIQTSIRLHQTETVILMVHSDCGAYGGLQAFQGDTEKEAENHRQDLHRAAQFLHANIPEIAVRGYFVDFDGVFEAEVPLRAEVPARRG